MRLSQAATPYLERSGLVRTVRGPLPAAAPAVLAAHGYPVAPPLPAPDVLRAAGGLPPDGGPTSCWPDPDAAAPG